MGTANMQTENDEFDRRVVVDAFFRLMYEIYTHGPISLVEDKGHMDLVNSKVRLCCKKEPFLDALSAMKKQELVEELVSESPEKTFGLTEKGLLSATVMRSQSRSDALCSCKHCGAIFNEIIRALLISGALKINLGYVGHGHHPHIMGQNAVKFCCDRKPYLEAICILERYRIVERDEEFVYKLTRQGRASAQMMLITTAPPSETAWKN